MIRDVVNRTVRDLLLYEPSVEIIECDDPILSVGDALRWLDTWNEDRSVITSWALVVPGTLVTNVSLLPLIQAHKAREAQKGKGPQAVLTMVLTAAGRRDGISVLTQGGRILDVAQRRVLPCAPGHGLTLSPQVLNDVRQKADDVRGPKVEPVKIAAGVEDARIYLITGQLLCDFRDDGKWAGMVEDCLPGQIAQLETVNHVAFAEFVCDAFSMTIDDIDDYLEVNRALIERKLYPITIETNLFGRFAHELPGGDSDEEEDGVTGVEEVPLESCYLMDAGLAYVHDDAVRQSPLDRVVVGPATTIGSQCRIVRTTIGAQCKVGDNVVLEDCVIWDSVQIGDGVVMRHSVVASGAELDRGVEVEFGCILDFGVTVTTNLPRMTRIGAGGGDVVEGRAGGALREDRTPGWLTTWSRDGRRLPAADEEMTGAPVVPAVLEHELAGLRLWWRLSPSDFPIAPGEFAVHEGPSDGEFEPSDEDDDVVKLNAGFQAAAARLCAEVIDARELTRNLSALMAERKASSIDCAAAIMAHVMQGSAGGVEKALEGYVSVLAEFLGERATQTDLLFWLQGFCAKELAKRRRLFVDTVQACVAGGLVMQAAIEQWEVEQEDMTDAQQAIFAAWHDGQP